MTDIAETRTLEATEEDAGQRLDRWLAASVESLSRSRLKALIEAGQVGWMASP